MQVVYKNKQLERICTNVSCVERKFGLDMARKIHQRINEILVSSDVEFMVSAHIGRCHKLIGNRKNQYAMDLVHPYRLIFEVIANTVQVAKIEEIIDYH